MTIVLWVILIHLIELVALGGYLLIRKNRKLESIVSEQQNYIDAVSIIINDSNETIKQLDARGAFEADDEVGTFFRNLKEIQDPLKLRYNSWREYLVSNVCNNLVINCISPSFSIILDWFYIKNSKKGLYDNKTQFDKINLFTYDTQQKFEKCVGDILNYLKNPSSIPSDNIFKMIIQALGQVSEQERYCLVNTPKLLG